MNPKLNAFAQAMSFKDRFMSLPPGQAREDLIYNEAIKRPLPKLVPVEFTDPKTQIKVKYEVLPDYLSIDGIRVPVSPITAQRIANHFGLSLPTAKMSKQIWNASDNKIKPTPMSGGATINGKYYTPEQVVSDKISTSDTSIDFNQKIDQEVGNKSGLIAGHMKDLVMPDTGMDQSRTHAVGWYDPKTGKPIQGGNGITMHDLSHSEYASGARLVGNFEFTTKSGKKIGPISMDQLLQKKDDPDYKEFLSLISSSPNQLTKYKTPDIKSKSNDKSIGQTFKGEENISAGPSGGPKAPPKGFAILPQNEVSSEVASIAKSLLNGNYGDQTPFSVNGKNYMARIEPHFHQPPPPNSSPEEEKKYPKPWGWHKGCTIFKAKEQSAQSVPEKPTSETSKPEIKPAETKPKSTIDDISDRINKFLGSIKI